MSDVILPALTPTTTQLAVSDGVFKEERLFSEEALDALNGINNVVSSLQSSLMIPSAQALSPTVNSDQSVVVDILTFQTTLMSKMSEYMRDLLHHFTKHTDDVKDQWRNEDIAQDEALRRDKLQEERAEAAEDIRGGSDEEETTVEPTTPITPLKDLSSSAKWGLAALAAAAAAEAAYVYWDDIKKFFTLSSEKVEGDYKLEGTVGAFRPLIYDKVVGFINGIKRGVEAIKWVIVANPVSLKLMELKAALSSKITSLLEPLSKAVTAIKESKGFTAIGNIIKPIVDAIKTFGGFISKVSGLSSVFSSISSATGTLGKIFGVFGTVVKGLPGFLGALGGLISKVAWPLTIIMGMWNGIKEGIKGYEEGGWSKALTKGAAGVINSVVGGLLDLVKDAASWILESIGAEDLSKMLDNFSFVKFIEERMDKGLGLGLITGITGGVLDLFNNAISGILDFLGAEDLSKALDSFSFIDLFDTIFDNIFSGEFWSDVGERISNTLSWDNIKQHLPEWLVGGVEWFIEKFDAWTLSLPSWEEVKAGLSAFWQDPIGYTRDKINGWLTWKDEDGEIHLFDKITEMVDEYITKPIKSLFDTIANAIDSVKLGAMEWIEEKGTFFGKKTIDYSDEIAEIKQRMYERSDEGKQEKAAAEEKKKGDIQWQNQLKKMKSGRKGGDDLLERYLDKASSGELSYRQIEDIRGLSDKHLGSESEEARQLAQGEMLKMMREMDLIKKDEIYKAMHQSGKELSDLTIETRDGVYTYADLQEMYEGNAANLDRINFDKNSIKKANNPILDTSPIISAEIGPILSEDPRLGDALLTPKNIEAISKDITPSQSQAVADNYNIIKNSGDNAAANQYLASMIKDNQAFMAQVVQAIAATQSRGGNSVSNSTVNNINAVPTFADPVPVN